MTQQNDQAMPNEHAVERCEPPAEHRVKRWHWLQNGEGETVVRFWHEEWAVDGGRFRDFEHGAVLQRGDDLYQFGWRYIGPCEEPSPISKLDLAWEAVNALGGPHADDDDEGRGYNEAITAALEQIEKLGGKDPAPARARHVQVTHVSLQEKGDSPETVLTPSHAREPNDDMIRRSGPGYDAVLPRTHLDVPMPPVSPPKIEPKDDGGPAFPHDGGVYAKGMSQRDWFAGQALARIPYNELTPHRVQAHDAYAMADAMLAERAKGAKP